MINRENRFGSDKRQRYRRGDIVRLPALDCEGVILGSIKDLCEGSKVIDFFKVRLENGAEISWIHENAMELLEMEKE